MARIMYDADCSLGWDIGVLRVWMISSKAVSGDGDGGCCKEVHRKERKTIAS